MKVVSKELVSSSALVALGLDPARYDADSDEAIACAVRRHAAMSCPTGRGSIVRAVAGALDPIVEDASELMERVDEMIDTLVGHGDLAEMRTAESEYERGTWLVHAAPPSFVVRRSGALLLLGVAPDEVFPLPAGLQRHVLHVGHTRLLEEDRSANVAAYLADFGLLELSMETWLRGPERLSAEAVLADANTRLDGASRVGLIPGLSILDGEKSPRFYRRRWAEPKRQTGRFIARRPQLYGAALWCYVELEQGLPRRLLDLPVNERFARGCDEAWRLQAAIDACSGRPQTYRRRDDHVGVIVDFFSPLPRWAARRFAALGEVVPRGDCLFSRRFPRAEVDEELEYIKDELWLKESIGADNV